jgi:hypothetical protein
LQYKPFGNKFCVAKFIKNVARSATPPLLIINYSLLIGKFSQSENLPLPVAYVYGGDTVI